MGSNAVGGGRPRRASGPGLAGSTSVGVLAVAVVAAVIGALLAAVVPGVILVVAGIVLALLAAVVPGVILVVAGVVLARLAAVLRGVVVRLLRVVLLRGVLLGGPRAELGRQEHRVDHVHDGLADLDGLQHLGRVARALDLVPVDGELARGRPGERVVALALLHRL